ncbi:MAG: hypothetical protein LBF63_10350, partial [Treponema sp.]|nr:hypothetical protein [Treponema sp.]
MTTSDTGAGAGTSADARGNRALIRHGSTLSLLTLVSRVLGLVREMTKASLLGTSGLSDAFSVAFMIPNLFRRLFAEGSIAVAFIPTFKEYLLAEEQAAGTGQGQNALLRCVTREFLSSALSFLSVTVSLTVALGILITPLIIPAFKL